MSDTKERQAFTAVLYPCSKHGQPRVAWVTEEEQDGYYVEVITADSNRDLPSKPVFFSKEDWTRDESKWLKPHTDAEYLPELEDIFGTGGQNP